MATYPFADLYARMRRLPTVDEMRLGDERSHKKGFEPEKRMYQGEHGLTVIEMPDGSTLYSRDVHVRVKPQCVVEIMGVGKFLVHSSSNSYSRVEPIVPKDKIAGVELKVPYSLNRIKVGAGDFSQVETDLRYQPGVELRPGEDEAQPMVRVELGIPEWIQAPLREASSLRAEVEAVAAGRLHQAARHQAIAATVFITTEYSDGYQANSGWGTGFLINPHGYIVTNGHVVAPVLVPDPRTSQRLIRLGVKVTLHSGRPEEETLPATIIRYSEEPDFALLKIEGNGYEFLCLERDELSEMDAVLALGFPGGTMLATSGSCPEISFRAGQTTAFRQEPRTRSRFVEHSAPMEQGNSGGPLVTPRGTVVGVNTQLRGPQLQTRFALANDLVHGFFFQESAEGKGPYYGPDALERFTILTARTAVVWSLIDSQVFQFTHQIRFVWPGLDTDSSPDYSKTIQTGTEALTALSHLLAVLDHLNPPGVHYLTHIKVREGVRLQSETLAKMLQLLAPEAEDRLAEANRHLSGNPDRYDRDRDLGRGVNEIQAGRTQLCFAFNRVIGQYWSLVEKVKDPPPPFRTIIQPASYSPDVERHILAELGNIFLRHRGNRLAVLHFQMQDGGRPWERVIIYRHCLVSGSDAMLRELARLVEENDWGTSTESLVSPPSDPAEAE